MANAGIRVFQFRDKCADARSSLKEVVELKKALAKTKALCIVNDRVDIALAAQADGVHLGQQDMPLAYARKMLGKDKIIGISCASIQEALKAQEGGADYIGIGPCFITVTKPESKKIKKTVLRNCTNRIRIPVFAIGGINRSNINELVRCGVRRVAVAKAICAVTDPYPVVRAFREALR